jgi:hypothetical protein
MTHLVKLTFRLSDRELELLSRLPDFELASETDDDEAIETFNDGVAEILKTLNDPGTLGGIWEQLHEELCRIWKLIPRRTVLDDLAEI